jgi:hypothetical protein
MERIVSITRDLPSDLHYAYNPRPPQADNPPVSRHEFSVNLRSCDSLCNWPSFHDCMPPPTGVLTIECIPKKNMIFDIKSESHAELYAWGLEAKHVVSFASLIIYHSVVLGCTFGFWAWWQIRHPDDLQNAAVPITIFLALISLFWTAAGILPSTR